MTELGSALQIYPSLRQFTELVVVKVWPEQFFEFGRIAPQADVRCDAYSVDVALEQAR